MNEALKKYYLGRISTLRRIRSYVEVAMNVVWIKTQKHKSNAANPYINVIFQDCVHNLDVLAFSASPFLTHYWKK